ncbi:MAG TPA: enoyl-CoA hydratase/isomerase family protein [Acidimicrobiales bacterium]|nr:enoyl-CoA hydratase/isomerase family protein [Acidimicrobiales bacterium]
MSDATMPSDLTTLLCQVHDGVALVTLNRPEVHNAFNEAMQDELEAVWRWLRFDDDVRSIVLTGAGDKAFCTGIDRSDIPVDTEYDPFTYEDPGRKIGPKSQELWKPVVAAVNGMACAGGFYLLGECDVIIAAEHATFFDPHVTYMMTAAYEPILLMNRMAFGDLVRMSLTGAHERMSARTAREAGLVSEVVTAEELLPTAEDLAQRIAASPAISVQATLRTLWAARSLSSDQALALGNVFLQLGTSARALKEGQETFTQRKPGKWRLR